MPAKAPFPHDLPNGLSPQCAQPCATRPAIFCPDSRIHRFLPRTESQHALRGRFAPAAKGNSDQADEKRIGERAKMGGAHRKADTRSRQAMTCTIKIKFEASRNKLLGRKTHPEMPHPASRIPQCPAHRTVSPRPPMREAAAVPSAKYSSTSRRVLEYFAESTIQDSARRSRACPNEMTDEAATCRPLCPAVPFRSGAPNKFPQTDVFIFPQSQQRPSFRLALPYTRKAEWKNPYNYKEYNKIQKGF